MEGPRIERQGELRDAGGEGSPGQDWGTPGGESELLRQIYYDV